MEELRGFESELDLCHDLVKEEELSILISLEGRGVRDRGWENEGAHLIDHDLEDTIR
jgi:hypothetical protein